MPIFIVVVIILFIFLPINYILEGTGFENYTSGIFIGLLVVMAAYVYFGIRRSKQLEMAVPPIYNKTHALVYWKLVPIAFFVLLWGGCVYHVSTPSFKDNADARGNRLLLMHDCLKYYSSNPKDCDSYR